MPVFGSRRRAVERHQHDRARGKARETGALDFLLTEMAQTVDELGANLLVAYLPTSRDDSPPEARNFMFQIHIPAKLVMH
jgi:hypothetical protein